MKHGIERLSMAEYAHVKSLQGNKVSLVGSVYWTQVRPFFYRPLLTYASLKKDCVVQPCKAFGGYQYVVENNASANSTISFRVFDECSAYSLDAQKREHRRMVRIAKNHFDVRPIRTADELKEHGHLVYLSFYSRTKYTYLSNRVQRNIFDEWVDTLFVCPKTIVLGAYAEGGLHSVSVCYWIDDVLLYSTSFADVVSLKRHANDLMLHVVRTLAADHEGIKKIVAGQYSGGIGSDQYDLSRGGKVERRPAHYVICPQLATTCLRILWPQRYRQLIGSV
jgi:hypothetical protein